MKNLIVLFLLVCAASSGCVSKRYTEKETTAYAIYGSWEAVSDFKKGQVFMFGGGDPHCDWVSESGQLIRIPYTRQADLISLKAEPVEVWKFKSRTNDLIYISVRVLGADSTESNLVLQKRYFTLN